MFDFEQWALKPEDLEEEQTHYLIQDFLVEQSITMLYGKEKQGKSWLSYGLTKTLCGSERIKKVYYVDQDNPKRQLKKRNIDILMKAFRDKLKYFARGNTPLEGLDLVDSFAQPALMGAFVGCVFIFDSTRDFVQNTDSDTQAKRFMDSMKRLRDAGATIILIHHATKSGKVIDGSAEFTKSADNVYEVIQRGKEDSLIQFDLGIYRDRDPIKNMLLSVDTTTLSLMFDDDFFSGLTKDEELFVSSILTALNRNPAGLNKSGVLGACGYRRDDKSAGALLEKMVGRFWDMEIHRNRKIFKAPTKDAK